jgi:hypothetical protein
LPFFSTNGSFEVCQLSSSLRLETSLVLHILPDLLDIRHLQHSR